MIEIFNITWRNVSDNLTPWFWRVITLFRPKTTEPLWLVEYVFCIVNALTNLTNRLFELAFDLDRKNKYNGQVTILEFCLNDYFDSLLKRIYISDSVAAFFNLYLQSETDPSPFSLYLQGEINPAPLELYTGLERSGEFDFDVNVPSGLSFNVNRMRQIINRYRSAGMRYDITTF